MTGRLLTLLALCAGTASALSPQNIRLAVDVPARVRGVAFGHESIISAGPSAAGNLLVPAIANAARAGIDAIAVRSNLVVFSCDVDFKIGTTPYADEDLVAYDARTGLYSMYLDGSAAGIPESADIDAAAFLPGTTDLILSFDTTVTLPGAGTVDDDDIVLLSGGVFSKLYDGVAQLGLSPACDIDGLHADGTNIFYSLDTTFTRGAQTGTDRDIWAFRTNTLATTLLAGTGLEDGKDLKDLDEPVDSDGDWLTDFEEITGLDEAASTIPGSGLAASPNGFRSNPGLADSDGDRIPDGEEGVAGTNPTNATDFLRILAFTNAPGGQVVRWSSVSGKIYDIESGSSLAPYTNTVADNVAAAGSTTSITNPAPAGLLFYRVRVEP